MDELLSIMSHLSLNGGSFKVRGGRQINYHTLNMLLTWKLEREQGFNEIYPFTKSSFICTKGYIPAQSDLFFVRKWIFLLRIKIMAVDQSEGMLVEMGV